MLRLYLSVLLILSSISPLYGMDQKNEEKRKKCQSDMRIKGNMYGIFASCGDEDLYNESIERLNNRKSDLQNISFKEMEIIPSFAHLLLKNLVIKKEKALLSDFLAMYNRSYPESNRGINFTYTLKTEDQRRKKNVTYTLLDVAWTAYVVARAENKLATEERDIVQLLMDEGGELEMYKNMKITQQGPRRKVRKTEVVHGNTVHAQVEKTDLNVPILDAVFMQGCGDGGLPLEDGPRVIFNLGDFQKS